MESLSVIQYLHLRNSAKTAENRSGDLPFDRQARLPLIYLRHRLVKIIHPTSTTTASILPEQNNGVFCKKSVKKRKYFFGPKLRTTSFYFVSIQLFLAG